MGRLSQRPEPEITTTTAIQISPKLRAQIAAKIEEYATLCRKRDQAEEHVKGNKAEIETLFAQENEYDALTEGVRVETALGSVPLKIVGGTVRGKVNETKLMKKFKLSPKDLDSCRDPDVPREEYLGIWLPKPKTTA